MENLKLNVSKLRSKLKEIGVRNPKYYFCLKYPEYSKDKQLDNLWIGKIDCADFTKKLEAFTEFKKQELN